MVWSATSDAGIEGDFSVALEGLRGDDFAGEDLGGDDADGRALAREARFFLGAVMVAWLLYVEGAMLGFVDASTPWKTQQISNVETTRCPTVRPCVARCTSCGPNRLLC